ncbi:hypothetical protein [Micromonospora carbonacea]|uniref:Lipoprotein n=1 Tax=Micromonospora carbonacea TaxID=47853 RepID=A0A1C5AAA5_9ACTN|nr:hypothetical protein [Micromonospora carbonacea]SCF42079.1 hypothetical protein GA0070563_11235 [Micromonospora carbonacea]
MRFPKTATAAALLAAVVLAGCGSDQPATYDKPEDVVAALAKEGVRCAQYTPIPEPQNAVGRGSCNLDGKQVIVSVYATEADAEGEPQRKRQLLGGMDVRMVVGGNWTITCVDDGQCGRVVEAIGGKTVTLPKP